MRQFQFNSPLPLDACQRRLTAAAFADRFTRHPPFERVQVTLRQEGVSAEAFRFQADLRHSYLYMVVKGAVRGGADGSHIRVQARLHAQTWRASLLTGGLLTLILTPLGYILFPLAVIRLEAGEYHAQVEATVRALCA